MFGYIDFCPEQYDPRKIWYSPLIGAGNNTYYYICSSSIPDLVNDDYFIIPGELPSWNEYDM